MRPLELRLRNFRSYFGPEQVFDFRGRHLIGIVGPIGSGKSSILDAIAFALYGKTPSIGRSTKALIHQRADDGAVALRFEVEGEVWEAVRSLRRGGAGQHALYRLERDEPEAAHADRVLQEADVNARIAQLLGLEFDAFTRSVLLAQGRFAEFLEAQPADRDRVLKGLFGHGRIDLMREAARAHHRAAEVEVEKLAIRVEQLAEIAAELESERAAASAAAERLDRLREAEPGVTELAAEADDLAGQVTAATSRIVDLDEIAHRLPDPTISAELLERWEQASARRRDLGVSLTEAEERLRHARESQAAAEAEVGKQRIAEASALLGRHRSIAERIADGTSRIEALAARIAVADEHRSAAETAVEMAEQSVADASEALAAAEAVVAEAEEALHRAQHADMAMQLRGSLVAGEPCPVCDRDVAVPPAVLADVVVDDAATALEAARGERDRRHEERLAAAAAAATAQAALASATETVSALSSDLAGEELRLEPLADELAGIVAALDSAVGAGDHASLIEELRLRHDEAATAVAAATQQVDRARGDLDEAITAQQSVDAALGELRLRLVDAAARLGADIAIGESGAEITDALHAVRLSWQDERSQLRERLAAAEERALTVETKRRELIDALDVDGDFAAALAGSVERVQMLQAAVERSEKRLSEGEAVHGAMQQQTGRRDIFGRLAADLTDAKFVRFLLDEERARLCALGSDHFQRLSSGRYRFTDDGSFDIVDLTTAEAVRKADSLSGGETFLASLALALALAEMVARTGGRLDAFFLDEGFGTLDPEHLDLAMEGIEALVADGSDRLVVVVSHVPELRHRFDDLIVLDRDATTGDTRVVAR